MASGFQVATIKDVRLAVGEKARVDVTVGVGGVDGAVPVTVVDQTTAGTRKVLTLSATRSQRTRELRIIR